MSFHKPRYIYYSANFKLNKVIQILTYSDSFLWGGYYMMNALAAIYLKDRIKIEPLEVISFGFAFYMLSRSIFQIPIAQYLDRHKTYIDESIAIFVSSLIMGLSTFLYTYITLPWHLYLVQFLFGLGVAINMPAWRKTFAKFVDKGHEAIEYGIYDIIDNLSVGLLTAFGGYMVSKTGNFELLFNTAAFLICVGGFVALYLLKTKEVNPGK